MKLPFSRGVAGFAVTPPLFTMKTKTKIFYPEDFSATKFHTQDDKAKFANHFVKFVLSDFDQKYWKKWFYRELHGCFGFIAHYNSCGFWNEYFLRTETKLNFLCQCSNYLGCNWMVGIGDPKFTYCDVEKVLMDWIVVENNFVQQYQTRLNEEKRAAELDLLRQLKEKYEPTAPAEPELYSQSFAYEA